MYILNSRLQNEALKKKNTVESILTSDLYITKAWIEFN